MDANLALVRNHCTEPR